MQVRFRTYAHFDDPDLNLNRGYGLIEVAYNGSVVNSTFMGSKMRGGIDMDPKAIVVRYDDGEAHFHAFCDEPFRGDGAPPFAPEDAPQQWRYAFARIY